MKRAVMKAVRDRFEACVPAPALHPGRLGYTRAPHDNLLPQLDASVLEDFRGGDGGELAGELPKFCAAHSSAALAANAFGQFRLHPDRLRLAGLEGFTETRFEEKLPTGLPGNPPNLDFLATGPDGVVAVESKFTEMLTPKSAAFAKSYDPAVARLAEPAWRELFESLKSHPDQFAYLDATQLLKHYLGMRHSLGKGRGELVLLYVYWEPTNASELPAFAAHRAELGEFASRVEDSAVRFVSVSYPELWEEWAGADGKDERGVHVGALRARYLMPVGVGGG